MTTQRFRMEVKGMTCTHCQAAVVGALRLAGAIEATADFRRKKAEFVAPADAPLGRFVEAVEKAGYKAGRAEPVEERSNDGAKEATETTQQINPTEKSRTREDPGPPWITTS